MLRSDKIVSQLYCSLAKVELVMSAVADAVAWTDEAGLLQWANASFERIIGRPRLALLGLPLNDILPLERAAGGIASIQELLDSTLSSETEARVHGCSLPAGRRLFEVSASNSRFGGEPTIVLLIRDITREKLGEAQLIARNRDLETLLHIISHDLREPLGAIANFAALLQEEPVGRPGPDADDNLARIALAAARMRRMLEDIAQFAQAREFSLPAEKVDFGAVAGEVLSRLEDAIARSGARVRVIEALPSLTADRFWATQALFNLVGNALKFTRPGRRPEIDIAPCRAGGRVLGIRVLDRGRGVDPADAERVFQLFWRGPGREVEGTGAGLAIVRAVAERHGGSAWVRPRDGGGSEFAMTFGAGA